jgi:hypothetical protein
MQPKLVHSRLSAIIDRKRRSVDRHFDSEGCKLTGDAVKHFLTIMSPMTEFVSARAQEALNS